MCNAAESKPKPVFTWTLDGKPLTEMETRDEEVGIFFPLLFRVCSFHFSQVMVDADGLSKFSQSLIYTPEVWHTPRILTLSVVIIILSSSSGMACSKDPHLIDRHDHPHPIYIMILRSGTQTRLSPARSSTPASPNNSRPRPGSSWPSPPPLEQLASQFLG